MLEEFNRVGSICGGKDDILCWDWNVVVLMLSFSNSLFSAQDSISAISCIALVSNLLSTIKIKLNRGISRCT